MDDAFAVFEFEEFLDRFAVASGGGDVDDFAGVGGAEVGEENDRSASRSRFSREHGIAFTQARGGDIAHFFLPFDPAIAGEDDAVVFIDDEVFRFELRLFADIFDERASLAQERIALDVFGDDLIDLSANDPPPPCRIFFGEQFANGTGAFLFLFEFLLNDEDFELCESIQFQFENRIGLLSIELEAIDNLRCCIGFAFALADNADDFIECIKDCREAFEDVDAALELLELMVKTAGDNIETKVQEVPKDFLEADALRSAQRRIFRRHQHGHVHIEICLKRRVLEQVRHHHLLIGIAFDVQLNAHIGGADVAHIDEHREFSAEHDLGDFLDENSLVHTIRHAGDEDFLQRASLRTFFPGTSDADGALAGLVDFAQLIAGI